CPHDAVTMPSRCIAAAGDAQRACSRARYSLQAEVAHTTDRHLPPLWARRGQERGKKGATCMTHETTGIDWRRWLARWDAMQTGYIPEREARFATMLDVLDIVAPASFVAVDLAAGPGAISRRLLERFPHARCVAVDYDPVLLALGQATLGE